LAMRTAIAASATTPAPLTIRYHHPVSIIYVRVPLAYIPWRLLIGILRPFLPIA
jgi:hypothetical protein